MTHQVKNLDRSKAAARILNYVQKNPGKTAAEISKRMVITSSNVNAYLKMLRDAGKVRMEIAYPGAGTRGAKFYAEALSCPV
jgi:DNA-binding transcriptional regulator LsrR (DeoR family)